MVKGDAVPFIFFAGLLLGGCGFRIFIRAYKLMQAWGRTAEFDPLGDLIAQVKLKDTFVLDAFGFITAITIVNIALLFK